MNAALNSLPVRPRRWPAAGFITSFLFCAWATMLWGQRDPSGVYLERAKREFRAGKYAEALQILKQAQKTSSNCEVPFDMGLTYYKLKQLDNAIAAFKRAAACDPSRSDAEKVLGDVEAAKGDDQQALAAYQKVLDRRPNDVETLGAVSKIYLRQDLNLKAEPLLKRLIVLQPHDLQTRCDLGAVYARMGDYSKAERAFREVLQSEPNNASVLLGLGGVLWKTQRGQEAVPLLQKAAKLDPQRYETFFLLGSIYNRMGRYSEAAEALEQAARLNHNDAGIYSQLSVAYGHLGRQDDQQRALAHFIDLNQQPESETKKDEHRR
jgi:tetratricopeptide (TPR) repeat protein